MVLGRNGHGRRAFARADDDYPAAIGHAWQVWRQARGGVGGRIGGLKQRAQCPTNAAVRTVCHIASPAGLVIEGLICAIG
jgi:hypothetical protein